MTNEQSNTVSVIATANNTVVGTIPCRVPPVQGGHHPQWAIRLRDDFGAQQGRSRQRLGDRHGQQHGGGDNRRGRCTWGGHHAQWVDSPMWECASKSRCSPRPSNTVVDTIPAGASPMTWPSPPMVEFAYVPMGSQNKVSVIYTPTHAVVQGNQRGWWPHKRGHHPQWELRLRDEFNPAPSGKSPRSATSWWVMSAACSAAPLAVAIARQPTAARNRP